MSGAVADPVTLDAVLLGLRVAVGLMICAHGYNKVAGPGGLEGTAGWFESLGLRPGMLHARVAAAAELVVGTCLVVGFATPVAAGALIALMVVAALTDHRGKGFFVFKGGSEYVVTVGVVAAAVAFAGPGEWSLDQGLGLAVSGLLVGAVATAVGVFGGLLFVLVARRSVLA